MASIVDPPPDGKTDARECEESVDLTPGVIWTESQLAVLRNLLAPLYKQRFTLGRIREMIEMHGEGRASYMQFDHDGEPLIRLREIRTALDGDV